MFSHVVGLVLVLSSFPKSESAWQPESNTNDVSKLLTVVADLTTKFEELKNDREKDVAEVSFLKFENQRLKEKMEMESSYFRQRITQLESSAQEAMSLFNRTRVNRQSDTSTDEGYTAFYARLDSPIHDQSHDMTMRYNDIVINAGDAYNPSTGFFTCKESGFYSFSWSVGEVNHGHIYSELKRNGVSVGWLITGDSVLASATSQSAILQLSVDDNVDVRITYTGSSPVVWEKFSAFSGFLIARS